MTLPTPDAQSPRFLSQQTHSTTHAQSIHSIPAILSLPSIPAPSPRPSPSPKSPGSETEFSGTIARDRATHIATQSWDLATGGLKTLTAKRELPPRLERRTTGRLADTLDTPASPRSYTFLLVILACILVMLISGGIVLIMMLQT